MTAPTSLHVPLADPARGWAELDQELRRALDRVVASGSFILGEQVQAFEEEFAACFRVAAAVAVASGTDALTLALAAVGVQPGHEVVTPSLTSSATATAIVRAGGTPVFVDIDPHTFNLDLDRVAEAVTARTRALLPVHLYGRPVDMQPLLELASWRGIDVVEDACQAHGATVTDKAVGTMGTAGCFSFYPTKNLGAFGDGGIVTTNDPELADQLRLLRQYGWRQRDRSEVPGYNSRLDELQAAFLRVKLPHLDRWNQRRRDIAARYTDGLAGLPGVTLPVVTPGHVFHLYVLRVEDRDAVRTRLAERGVGSGVHYPVPVHRQPAFQPFAPKSRLPGAEVACRQVLSLPMFPQLSDDEVDGVIGALRETIAS
jgi:dTDP-4-amino-4,6-dideoxygalactose transaminase